MTLAMTDSLGVMTAPAVTSSVLTDDRDLDALEPEWDELLEHSDQRTFFLKWIWIQLWWRIFRPPHSRLFIITCRDSQRRLVGIAPLYWKQRRTAGIPHLRELKFLGAGIYAHTSEYLDIIARRGYEQVVADAVAGSLHQDSGWDRLCLAEIPADSTVLPLFRQALGEDAQITGCNRSYFIDTSSDLETFTTNLTRSARQNIFRRSRRILNTYENEFRRIDDFDELEPAMDALVRLHQARWRSKGEPGAFALSGAEQLLREAARGALREGGLRLWTLSLNKEVAAVLIGFLDNGVLHALQSGFDPAYAQKGLGGVMFGMCILACVEDKAISYFDFMGGIDAYKQTWTTTSWDSVSLTCTREGFHSRTFKAIEFGSHTAKAIVRKTVPRELKVAAHKFIMKRRHYS